VLLNPNKIVVSEPLKPTIEENGVVGGQIDNVTKNNRHKRDKKFRHFFIKLIQIESLIYLSNTTSQQHIKKL